MVDEVQGLAPVRGFRGMPEGDLEALAEAVARISDLARVDGAPVVEAEINPVLVKPRGSGVVALDGLIICGDDDQPRAKVPAGESRSPGSGP